MPTRWSPLFAALSALAAPAALVGDVITLQAVKDVTLFQSATGSLAAGAGQDVFIGVNSRGELRRALIAFDVSVLPPGSTITAASLNMVVTRTTAGPFQATTHRALANWGEGTSTASGQGGGGGGPTTGDATWLHRFHPDQLWSSPGGDFLAAPSATITIGGATPVSWTGAGMVADVQAWLNNPGSNFGWMVRGTETGSHTTKRLGAHENLNSGYRPTLVVTYTPPPGVGACCLGSGSCIFATSPDCIAQGGTYRGDGTLCSPTPCPNAFGACCLPNFTCTATTQAQCLSQNGVFRGHGTTCTANLCAPPNGACCFAGGTCAQLDNFNCSLQGGTYRGDGSSCATYNCPLVLEPYVNLLPIPPVAQPTSGQAGGAASYTINVSEFSHQYHRDLPVTRSWGYDGRVPGPTIEAAANQPVSVTWVSNLRDTQGQLRQQHYLPVDTCLHGPNMFGNSPRTVVHLHGAHCPADSDGYPEDTILPGQSQTFTYPNNQLPATLWYHDHALGITRLNVYMGLAGAYLIRDPYEQSLGLPSGQYEIPLIIQDRSFNVDGTLKYPAAWQEQYFGDFMLVNGKVWPFMFVNRGKYRFRMVNGCNSRHLTLALSTGTTMHLIGTEGGMLSAPVPLSSITLAPAERADIVIDFATLPANTEVILTNSAAAPYPGPPGSGAIPNVMKFTVTQTPGFTGALPTSLRPVQAIPESQAALSRDFILRMMMSDCHGMMWAINDMHWDHIHERPRLGTTEIWNFINASNMSHPMHMHLVQFQVLDRQNFTLQNGQVVPSGPRMPRPASESGWKDTVRADPMQITRVIARFDDYMGKFAYHCHILEHEDHEMMRQFEATCYANCDSSDVAPVLNVADFTCFLQSFASGNPYANCDSSTTPPVLNVADFTCFLQRFAAGCQ
jgi:spore coat protein A